MNNTKQRLCKEEHAASLRCSEKHYENRKEECADVFDVYKACKREETARRNEQNRKGAPPSFFPKF